MLSWFEHDWRVLHFHLPVDACSKRATRNRDANSVISHHLSDHAALRFQVAFTRLGHELRLTISKWPGGAAPRLGRASTRNSVPVRSSDRVGILLTTCQQGKAPATLDKLRLYDYYGR